VLRCLPRHVTVLLPAVHGTCPARRTLATYFRHSYPETVAPLTHVLPRVRRAPVAAARGAAVACGPAMAQVRTENVAAPSAPTIPRVGEPFSVPLGRLVGRADLRRFIEEPHGADELDADELVAAFPPPLAGDPDDLVIEAAVATTPGGADARTAHEAAPLAGVEAPAAKRTRGVVPDLLEPEAWSGEGSGGRAGGKRRRGQPMPGGYDADDESSEEEDGIRPLGSGAGASLAAAADPLSAALQRARQGRRRKPPRGDAQG
jgi:hypothetical protein